MYGEEIAASIVLRPEWAGRAAEVDIPGFCRGRIAHYKIPRYVRFVSDFPKTGSGKIQKFVMKAALEAELAADPALRARSARGSNAKQA